MRRHRLRREIIATVMANDIVNRCGPSFPQRLMTAAGAGAAPFTAGYEAAKQILNLPALWDAVAALDGKIPAQAQMALFHRLAASLRGASFWLARSAQRETLDVAALVARYGPGFKALLKLMPGVLSPVEQAAVERRRVGLVQAGAPEALARSASVLQTITTAGDLVELAEGSSWPLASVTRLYHAAGEIFAFDRVRAAAGAHAVGDNFERTALRRLIEDLLVEQTGLTRTIMAFAGGPQAGDDPGHAHKAATAWATLHADKAEAARRAIEDIEAAGGGWTFAKLTIANAALRELGAAEAGKKRKRSLS
jgi:glutamate dehydrogenase